MSYILMAYIVVAGAGTSAWAGWRSEWQNLGEFSSAKSCEDARQSLGQPAKMRCVAK